MAAALPVLALTLAWRPCRWPPRSPPCRSSARGSRPGSGRGRSPWARVITTLGTIALAYTGARYHGQLTGWDVAPATALIGLGQGMAMPLLIGAVLAHVQPGRAGAAAGILTATQQFGAASGIAVAGAICYGALGPAPGRGAFVSGMVLAMSVNAVLVAWPGLPGCRGPGITSCCAAG
ncbi:MAG TPA: hypothetical protein VMH35_26610 [Streptosporangiaceae bacterium]|nr:hypothetical protein [Streptosporangiaceae bacterium]